MAREKTERGDALTHRRLYRGPHTMTERKTRSHSGCLWAVIIFQGFLLLLGVVGAIGALAIHSAAGKWKTDLSAMGEDDFPSLEEVWSCGQGDTKVVRVPIKGTIMLGDGDGVFSSAAGTADLALAAIRRATNDSEVKGLILDVDSGGGGITASEIIYNALEEFRAADEDRVVVALFGDVAASGAYYVAAASDCIVAHPTTMTGSIGVLLQTWNIKELAGKIGVRDVTIKSGKNKDLLNPFEDLNPEQTKMLQDVIDELHSRFVGIVASGRELPEEQVRALADGRVFSATQAVELGLVDEIGHWQDAVDRTAELLDVDEVKVYRYEQPFHISDLFRAQGPVQEVAALLRPWIGTRLMYLWQL